MIVPGANLSLEVAAISLGNTQEAIRCAAFSLPKHFVDDDIFASELDCHFDQTILVGDVSVGVDGRPSKLFEGDPITAA